MTYATRAKRFMADQQRRRDEQYTGCEKSEKSEKRVEPAPVDVSAHVDADGRFIPPEDCLGPHVCPILGPCDHACGRPYAALRPAERLGTITREVKPDGSIRYIFGDDDA